MNYKEKLEQIDKETKEKWEKEQEKIKTLIKKQNSFKIISKIAGCDISFSSKYENIGIVQITVLSFPELKVMTQLYEYVELDVPYVPGFLSFREAGHFIRLLEKLKNTDFYPDLLMVDGNGILHKNRCGIASHLGVLVNLPSIGVAKSFYSVGNLHEKQIVQDFRNQIQNKGDYMLIKVNDEILGAALKSSQESTKPIYISIGNNICLETAIDIVNRSSLYKIPEPIRYSDLTSRQLVKNLEKNEKLKQVDIKQNNQIFIS